MRRYVPHALLVLAALLLLARGVHAGLSPSDWASWVQAVGSIAAILGAFWLSEQAAANARKLEAHRRNSDDLLKAELICEIFQEARIICQRLGTVAEGPIPHDFDEQSARFAELEVIFRNLPLFSLPDRLVALPVLEAPKALGDLRRVSKQVAEARTKLAGAPKIELPERLRVDLGRVHGHATGICDAGFHECKKLMDRLQKLVPLAE